MHRHYFEPQRRDGPFTYHEWGATAGGPVIRNQTFFFFGFQQHYERLLEGYIGNVPSQQMYEGNFDFGPNTYPIFNPFTTRQEGANWVRDPFPGNRVPQSMFDTVPKNLLALKPWREATVPGILTPSGPQQNLSFTAGGAYTFERYDIKIDHQFSSPHKIFGRYSQVRHRSEDRPVREIAPEFRYQLWGNPYIEPQDNVNMVVSDTYTIAALTPGSPTASTRTGPRSSASPTWPLTLSPISGCIRSRREARHRRWARTSLFRRTSPRPSAAT
jgi:hypothetical protein